MVEVSPDWPSGRALGERVRERLVWAGPVVRVCDMGCRNKIAALGNREWRVWQANGEAAKGWA